MESLVHNVKDMPPETRRGFETALGEPLRDDQRVYIVVVTPGVEPSSEQRSAAFSDLREIRERVAERRESLGVAEDVVDQLVDEAIAHVRSSRNTP